MVTDQDKIDPERLELRARPRPIRRLNKRTLLIGCAVAALLIAGAMILALNPPRLVAPGERTELYNTERKQTAEGLQKLPKSYADVPQLGPPSPGDIGRGVVSGERKLGVPSGPAGTSFVPNPEEEAERAERIRQARIAQQAKASGLFFRLSGKQERRRQATPVAQTSPATAAPASRTVPDDERNPLTVGPSSRPNREGLYDRSAEIVPPSQARKLSFVGARAERETLNPHPLTEPPSPYTIMAGSTIAASLVTGVNSDLPGMTIGQVTENVYDTVTGEHLLIPQGTRLIGKYDSVVAFGQRRALLVWTRIILPNGNSIVIENLPATDASGYAGLEDEVDFHTWQLIKAIGLATLLGVGTELTLGDDEGDLVRLLRESVQQTTNRAGQRLVERQLDVQPTITVRPGWPLRVIVAKDLVLKPYADAQARRTK
ncbi:MAG: conjugal transfer protein TraI [Rhizobiales bacterium]|nr:conjugal transfer protein TraI [Hyphomicrobiales bacterium]